MVNYEKLRKHTTYELVYEKDGEELFSIKPVMGDKPALLTMMAKNKEQEEFTDYLLNLFKRTYPDANEEELAVVKGFIVDYEGELFIQTLIGYKITTQDKLNELQAKQKQSPN